MFYYLGELLYDMEVPGSGLYQYITVRAALAFSVSLIISIIFGKGIIRFLQKRQIGETIRDLGLEGQMQKKGTPTMGGIIIIASIVIPTLLFAKIHNIYIILMLATTLLMGTIGFIDDYIKVFKKNKKGLSGKFKVIGQVSLGLIVGLTMWLHPNIVIRETTVQETAIVSEIDTPQADLKTTQTNVPFFKNNSGDYKSLLFFIDDESAEKWSWVVFIAVVIFIVTAVSNGANITDGLDGLATGSSAIMGVTLGVLAYLSGNIIYANYLNIFYIPDTGELVVFIASFIGAMVGFLWYNSFPAQVFMGDTGSLTIGGIIAVYAVLIRKELLIPILCGIFLIENLSVIMQVSYFKYTKRKYGEGRRIFLMSPLHHHYQKKSIPEPKIVTRFWIIGLLLAVLTIITLKIR
ncbi:MAG TPA: phospho-N-acetylmuramoyl-pentapeptide-transferase [Salinivirgaceae bacterium]|nr:phospho-N-acetylmuramoyl-pentapeptide-transferase [Salinivirgaceae bacterium]